MGIVDALVTWLVNVTFVLADFVKIAIGGTGGNSISILFNYQTGEGGRGGGATDLCEIFFYNSLVLPIHRSDFFAAMKQIKIYFRNI